MTTNMAYTRTFPSQGLFSAKEEKKAVSNEKKLNLKIVLDAIKLGPSELSHFGSFNVLLFLM